MTSPAAAEAIARLEGREPPPSWIPPADLAYGSCARCGMRGARPAYWGDHFCRVCAQVEAEVRDESGLWPLDGRLDGGPR